MPDMTRKFVIEVGKPPAESYQPGPDDHGLQWWHVDTCDTEAEAKSVVANYILPEGAKGIRARQFFVQYHHTERHREYMAQTTGEVPLAVFKCLDHPKRTAKGYGGGTPPRCPDCRRAMVPKGFDAQVKDLE